MSFLKSFIDQVMGPRREYPDASELNKLSPPPMVTVPKITPVVANQSSYTTVTSAIAGGVTVTLPSPSYSWPNIGTTNITVGQVTPVSYTIGTQESPTIISFLDINGQWLVKLNRDGTVTWADGISVSDAAKAFDEMLTLGAEQKAGITQGMKLRARDQIFEEIIRIAQERGPLSVDDLTFMLESSKIIEKLKGTNE